MNLKLGLIRSPSALFLDYTKMKQIPCPTWGALDGNMKFHLQTVQCPVRQAMINNHVRGLLVLERNEVEPCLTASQCHTGSFHGDCAAASMDLIKEALQGCSKMGEEESGIQKLSRGHD